MVAGFKLAEKLGAPKRKVVGIDASATVPQTFDQVLRIAKATGAKIGLEEGDITERDIILDDRYHGGIYGVPDAQTIEAIKFGASTEAFITDPGRFFLSFCPTYIRTYIYTFIDICMRACTCPLADAKQVREIYRESTTEQKCFFALFHLHSFYLAPFRLIPLPFPFP